MLKPATRFRWPLVVYQTAVAFFVCYLLLRAGGWMLPVDAVGQPRGTPLGQWSAAWQLTLFHLIAVGALAAVPWVPLVGVAAYLALSFGLPVHSPEWIYTRAIGLRTGIALMTLAGTLLWAQRSNRPITGFFSSLTLKAGPKKNSRLNPTHGDPTIAKCLVAFVAWYGLCCFVATLRPQGFHPALQFHPIQLVQALALSMVVWILRSPKRTLLLISATVVTTLLVRVLIYNLTYRDAGIATDVALALPLLAFIGFAKQNPIIRAMVVALSGLAIWSLLEVENRGAVVGLLFALIAFVLTSRHWSRALALGIPSVALAIFGLMQTAIGDRFRATFANPTFWETNERIIAWRGGLQIAIDHPIFGIGPGNFVHWIGKYKPGIANHSAHNLFVDVAAESGLVGLIIFLVLLIAVTRRCWTSAQSGCSSSRFVLVCLASWIGCGLFLTTTMFSLPYILMAVAACPAAIALLPESTVDSDLDPGSTP